MDSSQVQSSNSKRFVVENSITKVTFDGEPHEVMTLVAGFSGLLAAIIILAILVSLVACQKQKRGQCRNCPNATPTRMSSYNDEGPRSSLSTICTRLTSISESIKEEPTIDTEMTLNDYIKKDKKHKLHETPLHGNINPTFVDNEFFTDLLQKSCNSSIKNEKLNPNFRVSGIQKY